MSKLYNEQAGGLRRELSLREMYYPRPPAIVVKDRPPLWDHAADFVGRNEPVTYLEFGVAGGRSITHMARTLTHPDTILVGFDSFIGLPESWLTAKVGEFDQGGKPPYTNDPRVRFVKGWFQNTLHDSLTWLQPRLTGRVLIHFDADLYSSTLFLLASIWPYCPEYFFIMDDFVVDDNVALYDFWRSFPVDVEFLAVTEGGLPPSVVGKMTRKVFSI